MVRNGLTNEMFIKRVKLSKLESVEKFLATFVKMDC